MTLEEAAKFLRVSSVTLYRRAQRREVPAAKLGRGWRFHRQQLEDWIRNPPALHTSPSPSSSVFRHLSTHEAKSVLDLIKEIQREGHIERIFLFGSRARGDFKEDSDIDLLVVLNAEDPIFRKTILEKARQKSLDQGIVLQILVLSQKEWGDPSFKTFLLVEKIRREGIPLE